MTRNVVLSLVFIVTLLTWGICSVEVRGDDASGSGGLMSDRNEMNAGEDSESSESCEVLWSRQLGTGIPISVAVDREGNAYIAGRTEGDLDGANRGDDDGFLAKYDADGNVLWTVQIGTRRLDACSSVTVDEEGNAYVVGGTRGDLGGENAGNLDAFAAKYDAEGVLLWTEQLGTEGDEGAVAAMLDSDGNIYMYGMAVDISEEHDYDTFLAKYDANGTLLWERQFRTDSMDTAWSGAIDDDGNIYVCGSTEGNRIGEDGLLFNACVSKHDREGNRIWHEQLGTTASTFYEIAVSGDEQVFASGVQAYGSNPGPHSDIDVLLARYDAEGSLLGTEQWGDAESAENCRGMAADEAGNIYMIVGEFSHVGGILAGIRDVMLVKYDEQGELLWTRPIDMGEDALALGMAMDEAAEHVFITGFRGDRRDPEVLLVKVVVPD
ncbi:MAG: SBBP repeat-containing protein [Sedimentisphaerales bacterium]|nr:SBBP repeat-containing protein [Sedimentisphaerales bacterium]